MSEYPEDYTVNKNLFGNTSGSVDNGANELNLNFVADNNNITPNDPNAGYYDYNYDQNYQTDAYYNTQDGHYAINQDVDPYYQ